MLVNYCQYKIVSLVKDKERWYFLQIVNGG